jgi:hypothetical protein
MKKPISITIAVLCGMSLFVWSACGSKQSSESTAQTQTTPPTTSLQPTGTMTIDANISKGTRFIVYSNSAWNAPQRETVVPGTWHQYKFSIANPLQSLRFDPSEMSGATILIRSITINLPGQSAKALPLADLTKFLKNNAIVTYDPSQNIVQIHATGPDMDIMSGVDPNTFPPA